MGPIRVLLAALLVLASVTSCSTREPAANPLAAFLVVGTELSTVQQMMHGFGSGVDEVGGVRHVEFGPRVADTAEQLRQFRARRQPAPDSYSIFTFSPELFAESLAQLGRSGVPVAALQCPPAAASDVPLLIGNDNHRLGALLAEQVAGRLPADATGTVVVGNQAPGAQMYDDRVAGLREAFARVLPRVRVLGPFDTKLDADINREAWDVLVRANPDALAFVGVGDLDSVNIAAARSATRGRWAAGGFGVGAPALRAVADDDLVLVSGETFLQGLVAGRLQAAYLRHGEALPTGWVQIPGLVVTRANVAEIIARQRSTATAEAWFRKRADALLADPEQYLRPLREAQIS